MCFCSKLLFICMCTFALIAISRRIRPFRSVLSGSLLQKESEVSNSSGQSCCCSEPQQLSAITNDDKFYKRGTKVQVKDFSDNKALVLQYWALPNFSPELATADHYEKLQIADDISVDLRLLNTALTDKMLAKTTSGVDRDGVASVGSFLRFAARTWYRPGGQTISKIFGQGCIFKEGDKCHQERKAFGSRIKAKDEWCDANEQKQGLFSTESRERRIFFESDDFSKGYATFVPWTSD